MFNNVEVFKNILIMEDFVSLVYKKKLFCLAEVHIIFQKTAIVVCKIISCSNQESCLGNVKQCKQSAITINNFNADLFNMADDPNKRKNNIPRLSLTIYLPTKPGQN